MENYNKLKQPPKWALKQIKAGRLKGKSDINPQWRYQAMTEVYGPCGEGWKFTIDKLWTEPGANSAVFAFAQVGLQVKGDEGWCEPIPGIGGHQLIQKESGGLHNNDEAFKMAVTDALSTSMKMLGVAADIYAGFWDGAKYINNMATPSPDNKWLTEMKALAQKNPKVYAAALGNEGYSSAKEVPEEQQTKVYEAVSKEVLA